MFPAYLIGAKEEEEESSSVHLRKVYSKQVMHDLELGATARRRHRLMSTASDPHRSLLLDARREACSLVGGGTRAPRLIRDFF